MSVKGLIFDCDGTLVDTLPIYRAAYRKILAPYKSSIAEDWFEARKGISAAMTIQSFAEEEGLNLDIQQMLKALHDNFVEGLKNLDELIAIATIVRQYYKKIPMAVASSGLRHFVVPSLQRVELFQYFDCLVTVEEVKHPKPAPDIFIESAKRIGVHPSDCLVFEDSAEGMEAAHRANMIAVDATLLIKGKHLLPIEEIQPNHIYV